MANRLYTFPASPPGAAARLMLDHKGVDYELTILPAGTHFYITRLAGFRGNTVPALKLDGRRVQHSVEIAHVLEELYPDPPLYPADPDLRARVSEAEEWAEQKLQPIGRQIFRWGLSTMPRQLMPFFVCEVQRLRPVAPLARLEYPLLKRKARQTGGIEPNVRAHLDELPARLDRVDALIADGVIDAQARNAADFQVGTSVRLLTLFQDLKPLIAGRPAWDHALAIWPDAEPEFPAFVPQEWLPRTAAVPG